MKNNDIIRRSTKKFDKNLKKLFVKFSDNINTQKSINNYDIK